MGASESLTKQYKVVKDFDEFIKSTKSVKKSILSTLKGPLETLKDQAEQFFDAYEQSNAFKSISSNDEDVSIDLNKYFKKIVLSIKAFKECVNYINENKDKGETATILNDFRNDFRKFVKQLIQFSETATHLIINMKMDPLSMSEFYLELDIFDFALNVRSIQIPPYYIMSTLPTYELRNKIISSKQRSISIISPHSSGKTTLVPLFLICRILKTKMAKFLIVVEHDLPMIRDIVTIYRSILERHKNDEKNKKKGEEEEEEEFGEEDEENDFEPIVKVTNSVTNLIDLFKSPPLFPVIGVLSPADSVRLLHTVDDVNYFVSRSIFVIDDIHKHTVETDVLVQDLQRSLSLMRKEKIQPRLVLMSTIHDDRMLNFVGHYDEMIVKNTNTKVEKKEIKCNDINDITRSQLFNQMRKFFDSWKEESEYNIGSVVVFVPSDKIGRRLYKQIFKFYNQGNSINVCPLPTTIRKGEKVEDFYLRLNNEIEKSKEEKPEAEKRVESESNEEGVDTLYLMPMHLSENVTKEEINLVQSQLPVPLIDKVSRVFITTIKNESILQVNDMMVIFDTGLEEVDFFDPEQETIHVKEQLLPSPYMEMHRRMLGRSGDGVYFEFNVKKKDRPKELIPSVKRSDLSRQLLTFRSFGVKLENERGLPIEPDHELVNKCFEILKKIGLIADTKEKELTPEGKEAAKYPGISPVMALATSKFDTNKQFAYLCSLIIENSRTLIIDPNSKLLCKNFNRESDIVTLLESIREISEGVEEGYEDCGLSLGTVYWMCMQIESTFNEKDGKSALINSVNWAKTQPGGVLGMVDKFVSLLNEEEFLNKRKCSFVHVLGAGPRSESTLVYKASNAFIFRPIAVEAPPIKKKIKDDEDEDEEKISKKSKKHSEEESDDEKDDDKKETATIPPPPPPPPGEPKIKFARRPGWLGLQSPGNIIALSVIVEEQSQLNRGLLIHHDSTTADNPGVKSLQVDNPSLNSFFFVSLFEGYWSDHKTVDDFVGIYYSPEVRDDQVFLIHMTESDEKNYLNYCPKNDAIENKMKDAIPLLSSLMPFVPRSIIAKVDNPICAIEVNGYGTSMHYTTGIHLITEPDSDKPFAYPINKTTLEYAQNNVVQLRNSQPLVRFAITGESVYFKSIGGREVEAELTYPDVTPTLTSVFDPNHASHLVLLVDKNYPNKPTVPALNWLPTGPVVAAPAGDEADEIEDNKMLISVASMIMNGMGFAERSADLFYVTLGGGFPTEGKGKVPDLIKNKVDYKDGAIKQGIYPLIHHFVREFMTKQKLSHDIELIELSSTNDWKNFPTNEAQQEKLCEQVSNAIIKEFGLKEDDVASKFLGQSMLVIRVENLPENIVSHKQSADVWNPTYQPCAADARVINALRGIGSVDLQVTTVTHEPTINIHVRNMRKFLVSNEFFEEKVKNLIDRFGFLKATIPELSYSDSFDEERMGIKGKMDIEIIGIASGIVFASLIKEAFPVKEREGFDLNMTQTIRTINGMATFNPHLGKPPEMNQMDQAIRVSPDEIEALKELIAAKNKKKKKNCSKWKLDTNFNVLIIPATEEGEMKEMMRQVRDKENDTTCQFLCELPQVFLPQSVYLYNKDGTVKTLAICHGCTMEYFRSMAELQQVMDLLTHLIDRNKLKDLDNNMPGFLFYEDNDEGTESWPQIPIGQGVWALMSDADDFALYIKAWFTAIIDFVIRKARNYFTSCPNHPDIILRTPAPGVSMKCPYCNFMYHADCGEWHAMNKPCSVDDDGIKKCPNCHARTIKVSGCNHITCPCGKHWCYACTPISPIFNTAGDCYTHLTNVHGGYYT